MCGGRSVLVRRAVLVVLSCLTFVAVTGGGTALAEPNKGNGVSLVPMSVSASAGLTYTVRAGDGLSIIASRVKVSLSDLLVVNGFKKSSVIVPGQVIKLPDYATQTSSNSSTTASGTSSTSTGAAKAVEFARAQVGKPYQFNTAGPATYDCSGLTKAAYASIGVKLPHQSLAQSKLGTAVDWRVEQIRPGDLIFTFSTRSPDQISHVGIAISSTQWIEAPFTGGTVRIAAIPSVDRIQAVRRYVGN